MIKMMFWNSLSVSEAVRSERHFCKNPPKAQFFKEPSASNISRQCLGARPVHSLSSNLSRKWSFCITVRALKEGRCRPMIGASFKIRSLISDCSFSNLIGGQPSVLKFCTHTVEILLSGF